MTNVEHETSSGRQESPHCFMTRKQAT